MILSGQLAISPLDLILGGFAGDAHDLIIIFKFHAEIRCCLAPLNLPVAALLSLENRWSPVYV